MSSPIEPSGTLDFLTLFYTLFIPFLCCFVKQRIKDIDEGLLETALQFQLTEVVRTPLYIVL